MNPNLGITINGYDITYNSRGNKLLFQDVVSNTHMPDGTNRFNVVDNSAFATNEFVMIVCAVMKAQPIDVRDLPDGNRFKETTTAQYNQRKWAVVLSDGTTAIAGAIATVLGNPYFGFGSSKDGHIAECFGEEYDTRPSVYGGLANKLLAACEAAGLI